MVDWSIPIHAAKRFGRQLKDSKVHGFRFLHATLVAVLLHMVMLGAYVLWREPEVVDIPFKEIHIKLGDLEFASAAQPASVPDVTVAIAKQAPTPTAEVIPVTPPPMPVKKPTAPPPEDWEKLLESPEQLPAEFEEFLADAFEVLPAFSEEQTPLPKEEPTPEPEEQQPEAQEEAPKQAATTPPQQAQPYQPALPQGEAGSQQGNRKFSGANQALTYRQLLSLWVEKHKRYPDAARARKITGEAVIRLDIEKSGYITHYRLDKKTGHPILDEAVIQMIERANPVPAIPDTETARAFRIAIRFTVD